MGFGTAATYEEAKFKQAVPEIYKGNESTTYFAEAVQDAAAWDRRSQAGTLTDVRQVAAATTTQPDRPDRHLSWSAGVSTRPRLEEPAPLAGRPSRRLG